MAPRRIDHITGGPLTNKRMQPGRPTADTPTRLIGRDLRRAANIVPDLFVRLPTAFGRTFDRADAGGPGDVQFLKHLSQQLRTLAMGEAQLLVENRQQGMHVGPELAGCRAASCRELQGVPTLNRATAVAAP